VTARCVHHLGHATAHSPAYFTAAHYIPGLLPQESRSSLASPPPLTLPLNPTLRAEQRTAETLAMSADPRGGGPPGNGDTSGEPPLPSPPYPTSPRSVDGRISAMAVRRRGRGFTRVVGGGSAGPIVTGSARRGAIRRAGRIDCSVR
jgi:hypothetical protein